MATVYLRLALGSLRDLVQFICFLSTESAALHAEARACHHPSPGGVRLEGCETECPLSSSHLYLQGSGRSVSAGEEPGARCPHFLPCGECSTTGHSRGKSGEKRRGRTCIKATLPGM